MTFDDAKKEIARNKERGGYLSKWKHKKSEGEYCIKMHVIIEADLTPAVVYYKRFADPLEVWVRPASEFFDGRFERIK